MRHAGLAREVIRARSVIIIGAETHTTKAKPPEAGGLHTRRTGKVCDVAIQTFPQLAEFCKPILATGKVCPKRRFRAGCAATHEEAMRSIAYALPALPGFAGPKTYAAWPVWRDSTTDEIKFQPLPKKQAAKRWFAAKRFDLQTHEPGKHGGAIGRTALEVLRVLLFEFLDYTTGQLDPSYDKIARKAGVCRRTVAEALHRLKTLGLLHWQRRSRPETDGNGGFRLVQETNAYASLPPSHWRGYYEPPAAPPPEPGTWGDHPPLPDAITQAAEELRAQPDAHRAIFAVLEADPGDPLAGALAAYGRMIFSAKP